MEIVNSNIEYYNHISNEYDQNVLNTTDHQSIRKQVAEIFKSKVKTGTVLDFGGGTGLDLKWLSESGYKVFFYEPSIGMKENAIKLVKEYNLEENITFVNSFPEDLNQRTNAVIANFAVMNSIKDINKTFEEFSNIVDQKGIIFLLVINTNSKKFLLSKNYLIKRIKAFLFRQPITFNITNNNCTHCVYLHGVRDYKRASAKWFKLNNISSLGGYGFWLLQFERK